MLNETPSADGGQSSQSNQSGLTIGFDIGGTNLRAAVIDASGEIIDSTSVPTATTAEQLEDDIVRCVEELSASHEVSGVGLALAGFLDPECEVVRFAPHLPWRDAPVREVLRRRLGMPVRLEHDANSAAWGEWSYGAGRGAKEWVFFAVGTGIGATLLTGGTIYRGAFGTAPEFGHLVVDPGGRQCSCGKRGCLERYASGTALPDTCADLRPKYETMLPANPGWREAWSHTSDADPRTYPAAQSRTRSAPGSRACRTSTGARRDRPRDGRTPARCRTRRGRWCRQSARSRQCRCRRRKRPIPWRRVRRRSSIHPTRPSWRRVPGARACPDAGAGPRAPARPAKVSAGRSERPRTQGQETLPVRGPRRTPRGMPKAPPRSARYRPPAVPPS